MINNRQQQAGRRRGRNGNGGGPRQGGQSRSDNGNRIDSRSRGNASQLYEKYKNLASDAQRQGDRVNTEYYLQFADHYFRVISDQRGRFEDQQPRRQQPDFDIEGADDDYGEEGEPIRAGEQQGEPRAERQDRSDRQDRGLRGQEDRSDRQDRGDRFRGQEERQRRPDGERPERPRRWERDDRPRQQEGEAEIAVQPEVAGQHRADPIAPGEDLQARAAAVIAADAPLADAPRRRGRPRRDAQVAAPIEAESDAVDADRLPPSLNLAAAANDAEGDDAPKPRRRRARAAGPVEASAD